MAIEMRALSAADTFAILRLTKKLGIADSIIGLFKQQDKANDLMKEQKSLMAKLMGWQVVIEKDPGSKQAKLNQQNIEKANNRLKEITNELNEKSFSLIAELVELILNNLDGVEDELFKFLGGLCNMSAENFSKIDFTEFVQVLKDFFAKPEFSELANWFGSLKSSGGKTSSETDSTNDTTTPEA